MKCAFLHWINVVLNQVVIFVRAVFGKYFNTQEIKCRFFKAKFSFKFPWSLILSENKTNHLTTVRAAPFKWRKKTWSCNLFCIKVFHQKPFSSKKVGGGFFFSSQLKQSWRSLLLRWKADEGSLGSLNEKKWTLIWINGDEKSWMWMALGLLNW